MADTAEWIQEAPADGFADAKACAQFVREVATQRQGLEKAPNHLLNDSHTFGDGRHWPARNPRAWLDWAHRMQLDVSAYPPEFGDEPATPAAVDWARAQGFDAPDPAPVPPPDESDPGASDTPRPRRRRRKRVDAGGTGGAFGDVG